MAPEQEDKSSLSVPFLPAERYGKDEEVELNYHASGTQNVSFLKTCLNGINALSGFTIYDIQLLLFMTFSSILDHTCLILVF